jgi:hypothetical protein
MIPNAVRIALFVPTLLCGFSPLAGAQKAASRFQFEQFPVTVYHGNPNVPPEFFGDKGRWQNESEKRAFKLKPNFAGRILSGRSFLWNLLSLLLFGQPSQGLAYQGGQHVRCW